jgi:tetratricopeptide (TPR) repeat protein
MPLRRLSLPFDILVFVFVVSAVLGLLTAYDRAAGWPMLAAVLAAGGVYYAAAHLIATRRHARVFGLALVLTALVYTLLFILLYGHQGYIETPDAILRLGAFTTALPDLPITIHPNSAAALAAGVLPLTVALALSSHREAAQRALWWAAAAVLGYGLLLAFSRGALVALALTLLLALVTVILPRRAALALLVLAAGTAALLLFVPVTSGVFAWTLSRYDLYRNSLYLAQDYAFTGIGLGESFALVYSRYGLLIQVPFLEHPHNLPLAVWMSQGLLGLAALAGLVVTFYLFVGKVIRRAAPHRLFHGAWLGVTATLIHGLFDAQQYSTDALLLLPALFALIGLTVASGRMALHKAYWEQPTQFNLRYIPRPLPVVTVILLLTFAVIFSPLLAAAWETNLGALAETQAALGPALSAEQRFELYDAARLRYAAALERAPTWASANRRLGNLDVTLGAYAEAVPLLEAAATAEPDNPAAVKGLGLAYTWTGRAQDAAAAFNHLENPAAMADELSTWGFYRRDQGQTLLAAYAWDAMQALINPHAARVDVLLLIADTYRSAGDLARARQLYRRALARDPDNTAAQRALAEIG